MAPLDDLDATGTLRWLETTTRRRRQAEVDDLLLVLHWADLHEHDPWQAGMPQLPIGAERLATVGGEGTPPVQELALCELGIARGVHTLSARAVTADALDLRFRLCETWSRVRDLEAEVWVARRVASMTRSLTPEQARVVDLAVAEIITEAPSRVFELVEAKIIEVDAVAHEERVAAGLARRYVGTTRRDALGMQCLVARTTTEEVTSVFETIDRVADLLAPRPELAELSRDELRAEAFAWLGRPRELVELLAGDQSPVPTRSAVLYVHLAEQSLDDESLHGGVARAEGLGPHSMLQLRRLVGHRHVAITPVVDLRDRISVNAYEHPVRIRERIHLSHPVDTFPHASRVGRSLDLDHVEPYAAHGPPGQTGDHTSRPLSRTAHRAKTHLGYRVTALPTGEVIWRTPHGLCRLVDHTGTHHLTEDEMTTWLSGTPIDRALIRLQHRVAATGTT